jgi:hypothetical protein
VGIQNMSKEYLPMDALDAKTDRVLRLQARRDYNDLDVAHPMRDWERTAGTAASAGANVQAAAAAASDAPMTLRVALCGQSNVRAAAQMALAAMPQPKGLASGVQGLGLGLKVSGWRFSC